jgi:hypothetical protein
MRPRSKVEKLNIIEKFNIFEMAPVPDNTVVQQDEHSPRATRVFDSKQ